MPERGETEIKSARRRDKRRKRVERTVALDIEVSEDVREGVLRERCECEISDGFDERRKEGDEPCTPQST